MEIQAIVPLKEPKTTRFVINDRSNKLKNTDPYVAEKSHQGIVKIVVMTMIMQLKATLYDFSKDQKSDNNRVTLGELQKSPKKVMQKRKVTRPCPNFPMSKKRN